MSEEVLRRLEATVVPPADIDVQELLTEERKQQKQEEQRQKGVDYELIKLLEVINTNPCRKQYQRREVLGWSNEKMSNKEQQAEQQELVTPQRMKAGKGRPSKYYILTEKGQQLLRDHDIRPEPIHGSLEHFCLIKQIESHYSEQGYATKTDMRFAGRRPDIFCQKQSDTGIVEVVHTAHTKTDLEKVDTLAHRVKWLHLYFTDPNTKQHYERLIHDELPAVMQNTQVRFFQAS